MMNWFELSTLKLAQIMPGKTLKERLASALDLRYGSYDYSQDLRALKSAAFANTFKELFNKPHKKPFDILVCGANSGYEIDYLNHNKIIALDLSHEALLKLKFKFPRVTIIHDSINKLPFADQQFDYYIAMRTLPCESVTPPKAIKESIRVVKPGGQLIYSIPNGYIVNGKPVKGMYKKTIGTFDKNLPYKWTKKIQAFLQKHRLQPKIIEIFSEIIITAQLP